jgi:hypothetical protein
METLEALIRVSRHLSKGCPDALIMTLAQRLLIKRFELRRRNREGAKHEDLPRLVRL